MEQDKLLAVMGSPGSGKTTTAIKLAQALASRRKNVIVVFCDPFTPVIPFVLPANTEHETSLGSLFTSPSLTQKQILDACIPVKENGFISLLGYRMGESLVQYPKLLKERVVECLVSMRYLADYIILDCTTVFEADPASIAAIETADRVLYLATASLRGVSYYQSHIPMMADQRFRRDKRMMAISNQKVGQDWEAVSGLYGGVDYVLPYIPEIEQQENELSLFCPLIESGSSSYQLIVNQMIGDFFSVGVNHLQKESVLKVKKESQLVKTNQENSNPGNIGVKKKKGFKQMFQRKGEF